MGWNSVIFGQIHPENRKLIISGMIQDKVYFTNKGIPYKDGQEILYMGNSGPLDRNRLLVNAIALLYPIGLEKP